MKRRSLMLLSFVFLIISAFAVLTACNGDGNKRESGAEAGTYYCESEGTEHTLVLGEDGTCTFTLSIAPDELKGSYLFEEGILTLKPSKGDAIEATLSGDTVTLSYGGATYRFLKKITYTVKFDTDGNGTVADASVINGKTVEKPQDPVKNGYVFIAWYSDAGFLSAYDFTRPVRGDLTLYALFVQKLDPEFTVTLDVNGGAESYDPLETASGRVYNLPTPTREGSEFAGWWVSHFDSAEKLTYRYDGQQLFENTTLFAVWKSGAPLVSITDSGVEWSADGTAPNFSFKFTGPDGNTIEESSGGRTFYNYDFANNAEGEYCAEVTLNGQTTYAYYNNKALAHVSAYDIEECVIRWNEVPGAEKYFISYECASGHTHDEVECTGPSYNFSDCDMPEGGFVFTVKAVAEGHIPSVTELPPFDRTLSAVGSVTADVSQDTVSWTAVDKATSYVIDVRKDGVSVEGFPKNVGNALSFDLKGLDKGNYTVSVAPRAKGWLSAAGTEASFTKNHIAAPSNFVLNGSIVTWDDVDGAVEYEIVFNGEKYTASTASFELENDFYIEGQEIYNLTVRAIAAADADSSLVSDVFTVNRTGVIANAKYENGRLSWDAVWGSYGYYVRIGEGNPIRVETNYYDGVVFGHGGTNYLYVSTIDSEGTHGAWSDVEVTAYTVYFEVGTGLDTQTVDPVYKAYGDPITMSDFVTSRRGYTFDNWYTQETSGDVYNATRFEETSDLTLYAHWNPMSFQVTFHVNDAYGEEITEKYTVYYEQPYELPTPTIVDNEYVFLGWYDQPNGGGISYSDYTGKGPDAGYTLVRDVDLYANFGAAFSWEKITGANAGWRVSKNSSTANAVVDLKIPYRHEGEPVTEISDFSSMPNLTKISIPSSIKTVNLAASAAAFRSCNRLEEIEVYKVEQTEIEHIPEYSSYSGALYQVTEGVGTKLVFVPVAYEGRFEIMPGTQTIPAGSFYSATKITEIVIPASVATVETEAIRSCSALERIIFLDETQEGEEAQPLSISENAFYLLSSLVEIQLPKRLASFDPSSIYSCTKLEKVSVGDDNGEGEKGEYTSVDGMLCKVIEGGLELVFIGRGRTSLDLTTQFVSIGDGAFGKVTDAEGKTSGSANTVISRVVIPASVTHIGRSAFREASHLAEIVFLGDATNTPLVIEPYAFYNVGTSSGYYLTELTLPGNLRTLGEYAFGYTSQLKTVNVESSSLADGRTMLDFAEKAFATTGGTYYVEHVYLGKDVPDINIPGVFGPNVKGVEVHKENPNFTTLDDGVLYNKEVTGIRFFPTNRDSTEYVTPETLKEIPANLFSNFTNLTKITIGKNVERIGEKAFYRCSNLSEIEFVEGGEVPLAIGENAFNSDNASSALQVKLTSIVLPDRTTSIGNGAFGYIDSLVSFTMPSTLVTIGNSAEGIAYDVFDRDLDLAAITVKQIEGKDANWTSVDGVLYRVENGKPVELAVAPRACSVENLEIPGSVTSIWQGAFEYNKGVQTLTFAKRDTDEEGKPLDLDIKSNAFTNCTGLREVTLPEGMKKIGSAAFYYCEGLEKVTFPASLETLEAAAFYYCKALTTITFPDKMDGELRFEDAATFRTGFSKSSSRNGVFESCSSLTNVVLPEGLVFLGMQAFAQCSGLTSVTLPASLQTIGSFAFGPYYDPASSENYGRETINNMVPLENVTFNKDTATYGELGSALTEIQDFAFSYTNLTKIDLPDSVERIFYRAFVSTKLTSIKLPKNLTMLGGSVPSRYNKYITTNNRDNWSSYGLVFNNLPLETIEFNENLESIGTNSFTGTNVTELNFPKSLKNLTSFSSMKNLRTVTFADGTALEESGTRSALPDSAFSGCTMLESVNFGKGSVIKTFGANAFSNCTSLSSITIPASTEVIKDSAFANCTSLETVEWEKGEDGKTLVSKLKSIGNENATAITNVFQKTKIENFNLPESENNITLQMGLFTQCTTLKNVYFSKSVTGINGAFKGCVTIAFITVDPDNESFSSQEGQQMLFDKAGNSVYLVYSELGAEGLTIKAGAIEIGPSAFAGQVNITKVVIPSSVTKIGANAFENCIDLKTVELEPGSSLQEIGATAFKNCISLEEIDFSKAAALTKIGTGSESPSYGVFMGCKKLTKLDLSGTRITQLPKYLIQYSGVTEIIAPASLQTTAQYALYGAPALEKVDLSLCNSLTKIDAYFCNKVTTLTTVLMPGSSAKLTEIGNVAFEGTAIQTIRLPDSITTFGFGVFRSCAELGKDIETPGDNKIHLPNSVTKLGYELFRDCPYFDFDMNGLPATLTALSSSTSSGSAFRGTAISKVVIPAGVAKIDAYTFAECPNLTSVTFADGSKCTEISSGAFSGSMITSIVIPRSVTKVSSSAFLNCENLSDITFEKDGTAALTLDTACFSGTAITSIEIPNRVKELKAGVFVNCTSLETLTFETGNDANVNLYIQGVSSETNAKKEDLAVTSQGPFANTAITSVSFPADREVYLNNGAFANCTSLRQIASWGGVKNIGDLAFFNTGLTSITLPAAPSLRSYTGTSTIGATAAYSKYVFENCASLKSISFEQGFSAGALNESFAENCPLLETVDFTNATAVKFLGSYAFANCPNLKGSKKNEDGTFGPLDFSPMTSLTCFGGSISTSASTFGNVTKPSSLTTAYNTFRDCPSIEAIKLPEGFTHMGGYAFSGCTSLKTVEGFEKLTFVATYAFAGTALRTSESEETGPVLTLPSSMTSLGIYAFANNTAVKELDVSALKSIPNYAFTGCTSLTKVTLGNVTAIPVGAFDECSALSEDGVDLSNVVSIADYAFANTAFTEFVLGANLTTVSIFAFDGCEVEYNAESAGNFEVKDGFLMNGNSIIKVLDSAVVDGVITMPEGSTLSAYLFNGIKADKLVLPEGLDTIPTDAFNGAEFGTIVFPETSLTTVKQYAFRNATIESVTLPASVQTYDNYIFSAAHVDNVELLSAGSGSATLDAKSSIFQNSTVKTVKLPEGVTKIYTSWFNGAADLTSVTLPQSLTTIAGNAFKATTSLTEITIPASVTSATAGAFGGSGLKTATVEGTVVPNGLFGSAENLVSVTFTADVTEIATNAFLNCTSLTTIELPETVTTIGQAAFSGCSSLTELKLPAGLLSIGTSAFKSTGITEIDLPAGITDIPANSFEASAITTVNFGEAKIVSIGNSAFKTCTNLTTIDLPETVTSIGINAFQDSGLKQIELKDAVESIGNYAFAGSALTTLDIPSSVTTLGTFLFNGCASLASVKFNNTYESSLPGNMFQNCTNLTSVKLPEGLTGLGANTFTNCTNLKKLWIPRTVMTITNSAFTGWTETQTICLEMGRYEMFSLFTDVTWILPVGNPVHSAKTQYGVTAEQFEALN